MDGQSEAIIDLGAIRSNVARMADYVRPAQVMAVVKSDGYGHGALETATAAVAGGATWLGVSHIAEALDLRAAGITIPILCLMAAPDAPHRDAIAHGVDLSAGTAGLVRQIAAAARAARLHLKADTGMSRGGAPMAQWQAVLDAALGEQAAGRCEIIGIWSH